MANQRHLQMLHKGLEAWNKWRQKRLVVPDLSGINLSGQNLCNADFNLTVLRKADFSFAELNCIDLHQAFLDEANFFAANLSEGRLRYADFRDARLRRTNLTSASLDGAKFNNADLSRADFSHADLGNANFEGAEIGYTIFADVDLSQVKGLGTVKHSAPSTIGIDTLYKSQGKIPDQFLRDAGVSEEVIEHLLLKFPRNGGQGAENLRKKNRHVHENKTDPKDLRP